MFCWNSCKNMSGASTWAGQHQVISLTDCSCWLELHPSLGAERESLISKAGYWINVGSVWNNLTWSSFSNQTSGLEPGHPGTWTGKSSKQTNHSVLNGSKPTEFVPNKMLTELKKFSVPWCGSSGWPWLDRPLCRLVLWHCAVCGVFNGTNTYLCFI